MANDDEILTIEELGTWLKLKPTQVYSLTRSRGQRRHGLPVLRLGGHIRFRRSDVASWIEQCAKDGETS